MGTVCWSTQCWYMACCLCQSLSIVQGLSDQASKQGNTIKRRKIDYNSMSAIESWHSWNLSKNERYLKYLGERNAITHPVKWGKPTVWNSDYLRVWRWHKSVCRSCVFYELVLKCLLEHLLDPFQLLLELKLLRSAINPKQNDQPNRCTTLRVFSND